MDLLPMLNSKHDTRWKILNGTLGTPSTATTDAGPPIQKGAVSQDLPPYHYCEWLVCKKNNWGTSEIQRHPHPALCIIGFCWSTEQRFGAFERTWGSKIPQKHPKATDFLVGKTLRISAYGVTQPMSKLLCCCAPWLPWLPWFILEWERVRDANVGKHDGSLVNPMRNHHQFSIITIWGERKKTYIPNKLFYTWAIGDTSSPRPFWYVSSYGPSSWRLGA
jgi:hypothetical protein